MLVIKIEVHPAGSEMHAFEIGRKRQNLPTFS